MGKHKGEILSALMDDDARECFEEKAAIGEYAGGLSRPEAERQTARRVFEYRLTDDPDTWLLLLMAPGEGLSEAEHSFQLRSGGDRVLGVRPYRHHLTENSTGRQEAGE
jgi:hypothetical protein